jgi:DNA polymerase-4
VDRRTIAHLDMDAFYVAVELLRRPQLRGKPVVVAGSGPRAVVTTASYEARRFGVGSALPAAIARRRCPQAIFVAPDFPHYRERSQAVMRLVAELGAPREAVSLDEVYLDLSEVADPVARMSSLVRRIRGQLELDASVGVGPNKLVAKVASDAEKPRGFVVLTAEQAAERFAGEPPTLIPGIGPKTGERLAALGVRTLGELQEFPEDELKRRFGERHGAELRERSHFRSDSAVSSDRVAKSRSVESTFDADIGDPARLEAILGEQSVRLAEGLAGRGLRGRTIAIKVRTDDFDTYTRARSIDGFTADAGVIGRVAVELLRANRPERPVRLLGVRVGSFEQQQGTEGGEPEALRSSPADDRAQMPIAGLSE